MLSLIHFVLFIVYMVYYFENISDDDNCENEGIWVFDGILIGLGLIGIIISIIVLCFTIYALFAIRSVGNAYINANTNQNMAGADLTMQVHQPRAQM